MVKTRTAMTAIFASVAATLVGWQFIAATFAPHTALESLGGSLTNKVAAPNTPATSPNTTTPSTSTPAAPTKSGPRDGTVTGQSVNTPYGSVQVKVTVASGSISEVVAVHLTDVGDQSVEIDNYAVPILRSEVLQSQSAQVSMVSGATYTSEAYLSSLQSALDQMKG